MDLKDAIRESYVAQGFSDDELELLYGIAELRSYEGPDMLSPDVIRTVTGRFPSRLPTRM